MSTHDGSVTKFTFLKKSDHPWVKFCKQQFEEVLALPRLQKELSTSLSSQSNMWDSAVKRLGVRVTVKGKENLNIDAGGPLIIITNHPRGILDGISLGIFMSKYMPQRKFKFIANSIIGKIFTSIKPYNIAVENMSKRSAKRSLENAQSLLLALEHLKGNHVLVLHPAGEVSDFKWWSKEGWCRVTDGPWQNTFVDLFLRSKATVLPIHISGQNSIRYQLLSFLGATAKRIWNFRELLKVNNDDIVLTVQKPIAFNDSFKTMKSSDISKQLRQAVFLGK